MYEYKEIAGLQTIRHRIDNDHALAAIVLPSSCEFKYSASKTRVIGDGKLICPKGCAFIKPATYEECKSIVMRNCMSNNKLKLSRASYKEVVEMLTTWIDYHVKHDYNVLRMCYGGDFYWIDTGIISPLDTVNDFIKRNYPDKKFQLIIRTANVVRADTEYNSLGKLLDPRIRIVVETQSYEDMPLFIKDKVRYGWEHEQLPNAVRDIYALPKDIPSEDTFFCYEVNVSIPEEAYELWKG